MTIPAVDKTLERTAEPYRDDDEPPPLVVASFEALCAGPTAEPDHVSADADFIVGASARFEANVVAVATLKMLEPSDRSPTEEERSLLARFSGFDHDLRSFRGRGNRWASSSFPGASDSVSRWLSHLRLANTREAVLETYAPSLSMKASALDSDGRRSMISLVKGLASILDCVILVSHQEEFQDAFPNGYHIVKDENGCSAVHRRRDGGLVEVA